MKKIAAHVMAGIDGKNELPSWLRRTHKIGHLVYYGSIAFGMATLHEHIVLAVFALEGLSLVLGKDALRDAVIEFE